MNACLIRPHRAGLFSLINNVITCSLYYNQVSVDWSGCMYGTARDGNIWNHLFRPTQDPSSCADIVVNYPDQWLTYKNAAILYPIPASNPWRKICHKVWMSLGVHSDILDEADEFIARNLPDDYVATMVRAEGHAGEQVSGKSQTLGDYCSALYLATNESAPVFVMSGDNHSLEWIRSRFTAVCFEDTPRMDSRNIDRHLQVPQTVADARRVLVEVLVASRAKALVHPVSNMATAALYINPQLESIFLP